MNIEAERFRITMTHNELWSTAWDVRHALENTIKTHWTKHQVGWRANETERLNRLCDMFRYLGRIDLYEQVFTFADETFKEFNKTNPPT